MAEKQKRLRIYSDDIQSPEKMARKLNQILDDLWKEIKEIQDRLDAAGL